MFISSSNFKKERDRIRLEIYAKFTAWADMLEDGVSPTAILEELVRLRNRTALLPVDYHYFETLGFLRSKDVAREVLDGGKSEISWFGVADSVGDVETRLRYICEQELATAELAGKKANRKEYRRLESKICWAKNIPKKSWSSRVQLSMKVSRSLKRVHPDFDFSADGYFVEVDSSEYAPIPQSWSRRQVFKYLNYKCLILLLEAANKDGVLSATDCEKMLAPYKDEREWESEMGQENQ
jgi:hypothetical protein